MRLLLQHGATMSLKAAYSDMIHHGSISRSALHVAGALLSCLSHVLACVSNTEIVLHLLERQPSYRDRDDVGYTLLDIAIHTGNLALVTELVERHMIR